MKTVRLAGLLGLGLLAAGSAGAVDYLGTNVGAIPDNDPNGRFVSFNTAGFQGPVGHVRVSMNLTHSFVGDLRVTLFSPGLSGQLVLFSRAGYKRSTNPGAGANLSGNYVFDDQLGVDLWSTIAPLSTSQDVPQGAYRTSTAGAPSVSDAGGCSTRLDLAFGGLNPAQAGGTWTLRIVDAANGDVGTINSATLTLEAAPVMFASGFESGFSGPMASASPVPGNCRKAQFDYDGDGRSDYVTVRNTGGGAGGAMSWNVLLNNGAGGNTSQNFTHGIASDVFTNMDFDGDGITDATVWRPSTGSFLVRRSSRPLDVPLEIPHGMIGDNPRHGGDYDGDGVGDATVFRSVPPEGTPSLFQIRLSSNGQLRTLVAGESTAFPAAGIDLNGDHVADVSVQTASGGAGRFRQYDGNSGFNFLDTTLGLPSDAIIVGNHAGNSRGDITVARGVAGEINWFTREAITGTVQPTVVFGAAATDFLLTGDYDGDGLDDYAVWRPTATPGQSKFLIRRSTAPATPLEVFSGANGDYPVANSRVN